MTGEHTGAISPLSQTAATAFVVEAPSMTRTNRDDSLEKQYGN